MGNQLAAMVQLALALAFIFFSTYVLVKILRLAVRWLRWGAGQAHANATINLICFAIATSLYPRPLAFVVVKIWGIIVAVVTNLPILLQQQFVNLQAGCGHRDLDIADCLNATTNSLLAAGSVLLSGTVSQLDLGTFPLSDAILLTAIWLALANFLNWAVVAEHVAAATKAAATTLAGVYRSMSSALRSNIVFFLILAVGSYLSFSSVIAIPSLQDADGKDKPTADDLKKRLEIVKLDDAKFDARFPKFETQVIASDSAADKKPAQPQDPWINLTINTTVRRVTELKGNWSALRERFRPDQDTLIDVAVETYDLSNRNRKGLRETEQHFLSIELWYRRWWAQKADQLNRCRATIDQYVLETNGMIEALQAAFSATGSAPPDTIQLRNNLYKNLGNLDSQATQDCASYSETFDVPAREDFGGYLGVFGIATRWLLKTESLSLVLITGLLGFGLLGAACSTFIRNVGARKEGEPLVPNLPSVVIRGGSAAVLVFLAVYGGLAVFAGASANPNPYVVLFTCLAAAVFSDDAWAWGAKKFRGELAGGGPEKSEPGRGQTEQQAGQTQQSQEASAQTQQASSQSQTEPGNQP
jgi:hypothetical protein